MSMHKIPLTRLEEDGLRNHRLPIGKPSQLSDCFRSGMAWALSQITYAVEFKVDTPPQQAEPVGYVYASIAGTRPTFHQVKQIGHSKPNVNQRMLDADLDAQRQHPEAHSCVAVYTAQPQQAAAVGPTAAPGQCQMCGEFRAGEVSGVSCVSTTDATLASPPNRATAQAEPLRRGTTGICSRNICECEREGLGDQCVWLRSVDEPHIEGYPLMSGLPLPAQPQQATAPVAGLAETVARLMHVACESGVAEGRHRAEWLTLVERTRELLPPATDAELEAATGEPHVDGWPLWSGLPPAAPVAWLQPAMVDSHVVLGRFETCEPGDYAAFPVYRAAAPKGEA